MFFQYTAGNTGTERQEKGMRFRPCIDIHNGKVKQIVGGSLTDKQDQAVENFVSEKDGAWFAKLYREKGLTGGHIILLNPLSSPYYEQTKSQAISALKAWPGGMQVGGGITADNASEFLAAGADKVIVTSYVFKDGQIYWENLRRLVETVGAEHLVLDLSCRKMGDRYMIVTDRWQKFTDVCLDDELLEQLSVCCSEFLVHAVDVEGKSAGIEVPVVRLLAGHTKTVSTYAGGVGSFADLELLKTVGHDRVDVTIGSALDLFGGSMAFTDVLAFCTKEQR